MNPYKILNLKQNASKQEIVKAAVGALREKKYSGKEIAIAQRQLLSSESRAVIDFQTFINTDLIKKKVTLLPSSVKTSPILERLTIFD
ncbi:MAG: hypothetical protein HOC24_01475 [Deltaproteobacteria bacterium]|jgi:hypothetical protein|nr:hypothetical protein [Deltaproteobacteria bacterium]